MSFSCCNHCLLPFKKVDEKEGAVVPCERSHMPVHKGCEHHPTPDDAQFADVVFAEGDRGTKDLDDEEEDERSPIGYFWQI